MIPQRGYALNRTEAPSTPCYLTISPSLISLTQGALGTWTVRPAVASEPFVSGSTKVWSRMGFFSALSPEEMAPKWGDHLERKEKKVMKRKVIDFHDCKLKQQKLKTGDS